MLIVKNRKKNNDKKLKKKKKLLPTYVSCFFEHVTPSTIPRRIIILLNQYGRPKNEAKFLNISPILLNFNQFHNCPFFLTNFFITLLSFLASKSSYIEPQLFSVCLSGGVVSNTIVKVLVPVHVPGMPKRTLGMELLPPTHIFLLNC